MRAYVVGEHGPVLEEVDEPAVGPDDVLVKVHACALNRADLGMAAGRLHGRAGGAGAVLGMEWAGEVVDTGRRVTAVRRGERVMGSGAGAFAEYATSDRGRVLPIPDGVSFEQAATLPVAVQTMHDAVVTNGRLRRGDRVLVQGASSGVGLMAMQIARHKGAALVIGTSTDPARRARLAEFGADLALDPRDDRWVEEVLGATDGRGVDLVIDQVSGAAVTPTMRATAIRGRIVNVGRLGGERAEFDFDLHALRRITYIGVTFRTRSKAEVRRITRRAVADLWDALAAGALRLPIDRIFSFEMLPDALAHMRANRHFGKIVVSQ
ncbi:MAG TPA: zinc-binding dehydrogenase [Acidimicrobiales bacterium]|nr:zinc-binding dehydrogenase [Acidimicrobiales bacterium]